MGAYDRITWRGHRFDRKTVAGIVHAEQMARDLFGATGPCSIFQGSYSTSVGASAGTHDGGGALDSGPPPGTSWTEWQWCLRLAGFAAFDRPALAGVWGHHNHAIQIGNTHVSSGAAKQVIDYRLGLNALASHARDGSSRPNPIVPFAYPLRVVDLSNTRREAKKTKGWIVLPGVRHVQRALNLKLGTDLAADGIFGPLTRAAYKRWELTNGGDGDGLPTIRGLSLLGAARFSVRD